MHRNHTVLRKNDLPPFPVQEKKHTVTVSTIHGWGGGGGGGEEKKKEKKTHG